MTKKTLITLGAAVAMSATSQAAVILDTGFTGVSEAGTTASGFAWTSATGAAAAASTSLTFTGSASGFISETAGTAEAGEPIGVAGNIETAGSWSTSFTFTANDNYDLSSFDISSYSISGGGAHQGAPHQVTWNLIISDAGQIFTGINGAIEAGGAAAEAFSIDTTGTSLVSGTTYTFDLTVSSTDTGGNNIALNQLTLNGNVAAVPEPSSTALLGLGGLALILRRRK